MEGFVAIGGRSSRSSVYGPAGCVVEGRALRPVQLDCGVGNDKMGQEVGR